MANTLKLAATSWRTYYVLITVWIVAFLGNLGTESTLPLHRALFAIELCIGVGLLIPTSLCLPRYSRMGEREKAWFRAGLALMLGGNLTGMALAYLFTRMEIPEGVNAIGMNTAAFAQAIPLLLSMVAMGLGLIVLTWLGWRRLRGEPEPESGTPL